MRPRPRDICCQGGIIGTRTRWEHRRVALASDEGAEGLSRLHSDERGERRENLEILDSIAVVGIQYRSVCQLVHGLIRSL